MDQLSSSDTTRFLPLLVSHLTIIFIIQLLRTRLRLKEEVEGHGYTLSIRFQEGTVHSDA